MGDILKWLWGILRPKKKASRLRIIEKLENLKDAYFHHREQIEELKYKIDAMNTAIIRIGNAYVEQAHAKEDEKFKEGALCPMNIQCNEYMADLTNAALCLYQGVGGGCEPYDAMRAE